MINIARSDLQKIIVQIEQK